MHAVARATSRRALQVGLSRRRRTWCRRWRAAAGRQLRAQHLGQRQRHGARHVGGGHRVQAKEPYGFACPFPVGRTKPCASRLRRSCRRSPMANLALQGAGVIGTRSVGKVAPQQGVEVAVVLGCPMPAQNRSGVPGGEDRDGALMPADSIPRQLVEGRRRTKRRSPRRSSRPGRRGPRPADLPALASS